MSVREMACGNRREEVPDCQEVPEKEPTWFLKPTEFLVLCKKPCEVLRELLQAPDLTERQARSIFLGCLKYGTTECTRSCQTGILRRVHVQVNGYDCDIILIDGRHHDGTPKLCNDGIKQVVYLKDCVVRG